MGYIQLIEDGDARAFRAGSEGKAHAFRSEEEGELTKAFRAAVAEALVAGNVGDLEGVERDMAREMAAQVGIRKDAGDALMVAWYPPAELAGRLAALVPGGETAGDLHLTVAYLGDPDADGSGPWDVDAIAAVVKLFTLHGCAAGGEVTGIGRFVGDDDTDVVIALVDVPGLLEMRGRLLDELCYHGALAEGTAIWNPTHGYVPHITLAYVPKGTEVRVALDAPIEFALGSLSVCRGSEKATFAFSPERSEGLADFATYYKASLEASTARKAANIPGPDSARRALALKSLAAAPLSEDGGLTYAVEKAVDESRFTLGPLYAPERKDAHGEYTDEDTLQSAVWGYVRSSAEEGRRLHLQHDDYGDITVGEWVEVMAWPYDHEITLKSAAGVEATQKMPAGTVYLGVVWDEDCWPLVKSGKIGGYSLGGRAVRVGGVDDLPAMGYKHAAADGKTEHVYEAGPDEACKMCGLEKSAACHVSASA